MGPMLSLARRALLAALIVFSTPAWAEVTADVSPQTGHIVISGLDAQDQANLLADDSQVQLTVAGLQSTRGMPLSLYRLGDDLSIAPRFELRLGTPYKLSLNLDTQAHVFDIVLEALDAPTPRLVGFSPSQAVIPANTLRVYLEFSQPMALGQLHEAVSLVRSDGSEVPSPFLTLGPELWDHSQTRVTLLFDPGRIKQGVGPNVEVGPPLEDGETYRLLVSETMESALGAPLGETASVTFRVGPTERRSIDPQDWQILTPPAGGQSPLTVAFDRILDSGASQRMLLVQDPAGNLVNGRIESDGGGWSLNPDRPWAAGTYTLVVDPNLEDVSGNRPGAPFDAEAGTIGVRDDPVTLAFEVFN